MMHFSRLTGNGNRNRNSWRNQSGVVTVVMHGVLAVDGLMIIVSGIGHGDRSGSRTHWLVTETGNASRSHSSGMSVMVSVVLTQRRDVVTSRRRSAHASVAVGRRVDVIWRYMVMKIASWLLLESAAGPSHARRWHRGCYVSHWRHARSRSHRCHGASSA